MHRLPGLDLLRAIAIVSVVCTHAWIVGGMGYGFGWIEEYGWMGVDLFFVLSGYPAPVCSPRADASRHSILRAGARIAEG
jgi:surface polysaccharide O-acyltransferase-like enzyme